MSLLYRIERLEREYLRLAEQNRARDDGAARTEVLARIERAMAVVPPERTLAILDSLGGTPETIPDWNFGELFSLFECLVAPPRP